jgi:acetyl/propionyl-CoA carboxylase alpha subunit
VFEVVLVAAPGQQAVRLLTAAQALGVKAIAVHVKDDVDADHVRVADEAVLLGEAGGYADPLRVVEAARQSGAQAVLPADGPLAGSDVARALAADAGLAWLEGAGDLTDLAVLSKLLSAGP